MGGSYVLARETNWKNTLAKNILYIHGLDSEPNLKKLDIIRQFGHQPHALHLDYRKDRFAYAKLKKEAKDKKVDFIIGSSLGGYYGYWLGHDLHINQLLFNPAMPFRSVQVQTLDIDENPTIKSWVVLGVNDEIIPPNLNVSFFKSRDSIRLISCQWLGHRIDETTFEEMIRWTGL